MPSATTCDCVPGLINTKPQAGLHPLILCQHTSDVRKRPGDADLSTAGLSSQKRGSGSSGGCQRALPTPIAGLASQGNPLSLHCCHPRAAAAEEALLSARLLGSYQPPAGSSQRKRFAGAGKAPLSCPLQPPSQFLPPTSSVLSHCIAVEEFAALGAKRIPPNTGIPCSLFSTAPPVQIRKVANPPTHNTLSSPSASPLPVGANRFTKAWPTCCREGFLTSVAPLYF